MGSTVSSSFAQGNSSPIQSHELTIYIYGNYHHSPGDYPWQTRWRHQHPQPCKWEWLSIFPMAFMEPSLSSSMASIYIYIYIYICTIYIYIYIYGCVCIYIYMYVIYTYVIYIYISLSIYVICPHFRIEGNAEAIAFGSHHTIHRWMCFQMCSHHLRCLRRRLVDFGHWNPVILILPWGNPNVRKDVEILQLPSGNLIWQWNIPSLKGIQNLWMGDFALAG